MVGELSAAGISLAEIEEMPLPLMRATLRAIYGERHRATEAQAHILSELFKALASTLMR